jgi:hypothetical protein
MTTTKKTTRRRTKGLATAMQVERLPEEVRRKAACVLEVLAGLRTPEEAAEALGTSLQTYYNLETRALRGLVLGCSPESPGRKAALEKQVRDANDRCDQLEREVKRYRALLRSTQRAAEMLPSAKPKRATAKKTGTRARKARKPRVRALRALDALDTPVAIDSSSTNGPAVTTATEATS